MRICILLISTWFIWNAKTAKTRPRSFFSFKTHQNSSCMYIPKKVIVVHVHYLECRFVAAQCWMKVLNVMLNALSCQTRTFTLWTNTRLCGRFNYIADAVLRLLHHEIFMCDLINSRYDWVSPITNTWKHTCIQVWQVLKLSFSLCCVCVWMAIYVF